VTIAATDANPVVNDSNVTITATSGNHMLFIGGTHDTAVLTGGTETVQAYQGYNTITTGSGNDTLRFGGSGNRIDAGAGHNTLYESGSANTLVTPGAGQGLDDFYGYVLQNGDVLDFTAALKGTAWDRKVSDVGSYLHVGMSGNDAIISISNNAGGAASKAADLHGSGAVDLKTLLAHSTI
jgi:Ca2+-binding RTX toxin-like protein